MDGLSSALIWSDKMALPLHREPGHTQSGEAQNRDLCARLRTTSVDDRRAAHDGRRHHCHNAVILIRPERHLSFDSET